MTSFDGRRRPSVAGTFYPGEPDRLSAEIERHLSSGRNRRLSGRIRALIVPHAGYRYSGPSAGKAFALLEHSKAFSRAVILAPSHRVPLGQISVGDYAFFETPLGTIPVDTETCEELLQTSDLVTARRDAHAQEHALEVQLPFVQAVLPDVPIVPVVCGQIPRGEIAPLGSTLASVLWKKDTVWIVSSDFTHYGRRFGYTPFSKNIHDRIEQLDKGAVDYITALDSEGFLDYVDRTGATICGRCPIALLLAGVNSVDAELKGTLVAYTSSGRMTNDDQHSVSYAAIAMSEPDQTDAPENVADSNTSRLSEEDRHRLLSLARTAINSHLDAGDGPDAPDNSEMSENLKSPGASFVTLRNADGSLRGCVGSLVPGQPLYRDVTENARRAAFQDSRFKPVEKEETEALKIEISVLTPPDPIQSPDDFVVGKHGIIIEKGRHRAVFLPQVATEQGWDRRSTLRNLARKAGLAPGEWRNEASFSVFEAEVFGESRRGTTL